MQYSVSNLCVWNSIFLHFVVITIRVVVQLWFVVLCWCVKKTRVRQKYSENYVDVGIIAVEISRTGPTTRYSN